MGSIPVAQPAKAPVSRLKTVPQRSPMAKLKAGVEVWNRWRLSKFVIADLTDAKSVLQELTAITDGLVGTIQRLRSCISNQTITDYCIPGLTDGSLYGTHCEWWL